MSNMKTFSYRVLLIKKKTVPARQLFESTFMDYVYGVFWSTLFMINVSEPMFDRERIT